MRKTLLLSCLAILVSGCPFPYGYKYHTGIFPENPVNLVEFNTEFDDYNATAPTLGQTFPLCFSTNRNSYGEHFDFVYRLMTIEFSKSDGDLEVSHNTSSNLDVNIRNGGINRALQKVNTQGNEFGPHLVPLGRNYQSESVSGSEESYLLLYSSDNGDQQDILFSHNKDTLPYSPPAPVSFLNSAYNDQYPCVDGDSVIYFSSDREGVYHVYRAAIDTETPLYEALSDTLPREVQNIEILSSPGDDRCPFVAEGFMVFASNREGGFGGYDLYYSKWKSGGLTDPGSWSEPVNCGEKVNTAYDEFRPILLPHFDFTNDFLLFSSNRPGGKGGFDLYYTGVGFVKPFN